MAIPMHSLLTGSGGRDLSRAGNNRPPSAAPVRIPRLRPRPFFAAVDGRSSQMRQFRVELPRGGRIVSRPTAGDASRKSAWPILSNARMGTWSCRGTASGRRA